MKIFFFAVLSDEALSQTYYAMAAAEVMLSLGLILSGLELAQRLHYKLELGWSWNSLGQVELSYMMVLKGPEGRTMEDNGGH